MKPRAPVDFDALSDVPVPVETSARILWRVFADTTFDDRRLSGLVALAGSLAAFGVSTHFVNPGLSKRRGSER